MALLGKSIYHLEPNAQQLLYAMVSCALFDPCEKTTDAVLTVMGVFFGIHLTRQEIAFIKECK